MINQAVDRGADNHHREALATPCVDVLIAARDRADTIERAVSSALTQEAVRTIIVVDDGSMDDTAARARACEPGGNRVVVERLSSSQGPAAARNVAIELSVAPWLAILDADDFFRAGQILILLSHSNDCDLVADDLIHVREGRIDHGPSVSVQHDPSGTAARLTFEQFVLGNVTRRNSHRKELGYLQPLIRRRFLDLHGLRYNETLRFGEDYDLYARALAAGARFLLIPYQGYVAVERATSLSARHNRQDLQALRNSNRKLMAIKHLSPSESDALVKLDWDLGRRMQWLVLVKSLRSHNYAPFLSTFFHSPALTLYLTGRLIAEVPAQIRKRLRRLSTVNESISKGDNS